MRQLSLIFILGLIVLLCSCGGGDHSPAIGVTLAQGSTATIVQGQQKSLSVTITNDPKNMGVTWTLAGASCTGAACGALTNATATSVMFTAPASVPSNMTVTVTARSAADATKVATITITLMPPPSITTTSLPNGVQNVTYTTTTLAAAGGIAPRTWSVTVGTLPAGLTLNASTGAISGKPTATGSSNFTVQVSDSSSPALTATKALSILVDPPPPLSVTTTTLPGGSQNIVYSTTLAASGGTTPYIAWVVTAGALPAGLTLHSATGIIDGTPTAFGTFDITVQVTDSTTPALTATKAFSIVIAPPPVNISTTTLPGGTVNSTYAGATLAASGGVPPISWSVTAGAMPAGLTLNGVTGAIDGTPTAAGTFNFTVTATDAWSTPQTKTQALSIVVAPALSITTASVPDGAMNTPYSTTLISNGGTAPVSWSIVSGTLPAGLTLDPNTGIISGTPTTVELANFTVAAADHSTPPATPQKALSISVVAVPLVIATTTLPGGAENTAYSAATLQATGGTPPIAWTITAGVLPAGLTLHSATGVIDGTPTANGTFDVTVTATDSATIPQVKNKALTIVITPVLSITTATLPDGAVNTAYTATLASAGGSPAVTWTVSAGTLPTGLNLNATTGVISGTPTVAGKIDFSVTATDHSTPPQTPEVALSITIAPAPFVITTTTLNNGTIGSVYNTTLQATGGTPPISWSVTLGSLPTGLTLHSATGIIDGTPTGSPATTNFTVTGTDSGSPVQTQTQALSITTTVTGGVNNAELNGPYAFVMRGYDSADGKLVTMAGSFTADGNGSVTSGVEDINTTTTTHTNQAITGGSYSVGADQRGTMTLTTLQGSTTFAFVLADFSSGVSSGGRIIETDAKALTGSFKKQDTSAFSTAAITGNFAFGMGGAEYGGRFASAGVLTSDGAGNVTAVVDSNDAGIINGGSGSPTSFVGTYAFNDAVNGRGTLDDTTNGSHMALYVVSANELFIINTDTFGPTGPPIFTGTAQKQSGTFTTADMNGNIIFMSESAASYSAGAPATAYAGIGRFTANGNGVLTAGTVDENDGGTVTQTSGTGTYTVAPNGRVTMAIDGRGPMPEVFYLVGPGKGYSVGTDGAVSEGVIKPQANGTFSNASLAGNYIYGAEPTVVSTTNVEIGVVALDGAGNLTGTGDENRVGTLTLGQPFTDTYTVSPDGRVVLSDSIMYILSPSKAVMINVRPGKTDPTIHTVDK